ncbi:hypothetical protein VST7929_02672 [Vibrio stylophorae]|uniref:tRNA-uridine aminocarboxypropyltransferase n=1 Tax=Vibrio stylophorae TaxID=659351 RepID=A0ABN8DVB2_9VIBR|nr:DTW domain-containing protein [Vibrio stylophorae]CAH0534722.1 hypothetical protein VST7929_02672 [Vibrio stylophorae]
MSTCPQCHFEKLYCYCAAIPRLNSQGQFSLLYHDSEYGKLTNTGRLVLQSLKQHSQDYVWQRKVPNPALLKKLADTSLQSYLLFPADEAQPAHTQFINALPPHFVILDATWQQARKMVNRSPYLQQLPRLALSPQQLSQYQLRRNQPQGHLCTVEVVAALCEQLAEPHNAAQLKQLLRHFMHHYQAMRDHQPL